MVSDGYHRITYAQHQKRVYQLASALTAWGVQPGDRVGTFMWNTGRHLQCYHALPSMGCVMHTINIRLSPAELGYIITHAEDRTSASTLPLLVMSRSFLTDGLWRRRHPPRRRPAASARKHTSEPSVACAF